MEMRLAKSGVVTHRNAIAQRHRLTGQDVAVGDLLVREAVTRRHFDLAADNFRAARRAHAGLAREWRREAGRARTVQDVAGGERHLSPSAIERYRDRNALGLGLELGDLARDGFSRAVGGEAL